MHIKSHIFFAQMFDSNCPNFIWLTLQNRNSSGILCGEWDTLLLVDTTYFASEISNAHIVHRAEHAKLSTLCTSCRVYFTFELIYLYTPHDSRGIERSPCAFRSVLVRVPTEIFHICKNAIQMDHILLLLGHTPYRCSNHIFHFYIATAHRACNSQLKRICFFFTMPNNDEMLILPRRSACVRTTPYE